MKKQADSASTFLEVRNLGFRVRGWGVSVDVGVG